jgi:hypothetical protein
MDNRKALSKGIVHESCFDCRRYLKQGDVVNYYIEAKEADIYNGRLKVKKAYKYFVVLSGKHTDVWINRWDILAVNGKKIEGGCFKNIPSLFERGMNGKGRVKGICLSAHDKA